MMGWALPWRQARITSRLFPAGLRIAAMKTLVSTTTLETIASLIAYVLSLCKPENGEGLVRGSSRRGYHPEFGHLTGSFVSLPRMRDMTSRRFSGVKTSGMGRQSKVERSKVEGLEVWRLTSK